MNEIVLGVLGRAQRLHPVEISAFFVASNHYHILAWVPDAERMSKLRGKDFEPRRHATEETGELSQLPCWRHLSPEMYRELIAGLVQEIEADAAAQRKRTGREPLGAAAILRQHPHTCPNKSKKSPAPRFHAATKAAREALRKAYGLFLAAFREAAERLRAGDRTARFPNGCFPPGLPFVRA
ncbi:MAG: hypothetical protein ACJ759_22955 [Thermoanaerobaculia bacterium]